MTSFNIILVAVSSNILLLYVPDIQTSNDKFQYYVTRPVSSNILLLYDLVKFITQVSPILTHTWSDRWHIWLVNHLFSNRI